MAVPQPDAGRPESIAAGGTLSLRLDFAARTVKVDNPTTQWLQLLDAVDGFVAPGQMGAIVALPGLDEVRAAFAAPPGVLQPPAVAGQKATIRAFSFWLPPSPGSSTPIASTSGITPGVLGTLTPTTPNTYTQDVSVPSGTEAIGYAVRGVSLTNISSITIVGKQTAKQYVSATSAAGTVEFGPVAVAVDPADTAVTCTLVTVVGSANAVDFLGWQVPVATWVRTPAGVMLSTTAAGSSPAPWQAPTRIVRTSLAAASTSSLLAGVGGLTIRVWGFGFLVGGGAAAVTRAFLEDTASGNAIGGIDTGSGEDSREGQRNGAPLDTTGGGLQLHVTVLSAGATVFAWAAVSQG